MRGAIRRSLPIDLCLHISYHDMQGFKCLPFCGENYAPRDARYLLASDLNQSGAQYGDVPLCSICIPQKCAPSQPMSPVTVKVRSVMARLGSPRTCHRSPAMCKHLSVVLGTSIRVAQGHSKKRRPAQHLHLLRIPKYHHWRDRCPR